MPHQYYQPQPVNSQPPFLDTLDLSDLFQLTNHPIQHALHWPPMPRKLPSGIPKLDGKPEEYPKNHVMTFYCWCSSNSLMDDSILLHIFQRTLTSTTTKWYIKLPLYFFVDYGTLAMAFFNHFQLLICYETGTKLITSL